MFQASVPFPFPRTGSPEPRLGGDENSVIRIERLADQLLGDIGPVGVGGVDEIDAKLRQSFSVRVASAMLSGGPQTRGPAMRMAPKPSRWISMSPLILNEPDLRASSDAIIRIS
jgi:hypothetical protein